MDSISLGMAMLVISVDCCFFFCKQNFILNTGNSTDYVNIYIYTHIKMHSGNQPWIYIGRTDAEAEAPILWPPDAKSQLIGKDPDAGKDWGQVEKEMTQWTWVWANSRRWWRTGKPGIAAVHGVAKSQTRLRDWTTKTCVCVWWTSQLMDRLPI